MTLCGPAGHENARNRGLTIDVIGDPEAVEWDAAAARLAGGSFYHLYAWQTLIMECFGHRSLYLMAKTNGQIAGLLPLTLVTSPLFGRTLCSMPFVNYGGPCADDTSVKLQLLERAKSLARELAADRLELRCVESLECGLPASLRKVSVRTRLSADPETIWSTFRAKHRTSIRRSCKNNLSVESGGIELLAEFYRLMELSWRELGTPLYRADYFASVLSKFRDQTRIFLCRAEGRPVAAALNGYFKDTVEGMWAASGVEGRALQANYVLYWEMIKDACRRGYLNFHLGRSTADSGAEEFKLKWNGERQQLYWYCAAPCGREAANLHVGNPKFRLAIAAWRRLPLRLTRVIGPYVARGIP